MTPADRERLDGIRARIDATFDDVIGRPESVALLMFPYDGNVGNHMMWLAASDYLHERGIRVSYAAHSDNLQVDALKRAVGRDPVLFLGGVTLSTLWPDHLEAKRIVAREMRSNRIVTLTSTVMDIGADDRGAVADVFEGHPDVTLLVRDPVSAEHAEDVFGGSVEVILEHDSALRLAPVDASTGRGVGWLRRDDVEGIDSERTDAVHSFDWPSLYDSVNRDVLFGLRVTGVFSRARSAARGGRRTARTVNGPISAGYRWASQRFVARGVETLRSHGVIVTDRMHPHVLSTLMGQPVVLLPDRFGKNRAVHEFSTGAFSNVHWANDVSDALEQARMLAAGP